MAAVSNIIAQGFGGWSTVNYVPTLGFGIGVPAGTGPGAWDQWTFGAYTFAGATWSGGDLIIANHYPVIIGAPVFTGVVIGPAADYPVLIGTE